MVHAYLNAYDILQTSLTQYGDSGGSEVSDDVAKELSEIKALTTSIHEKIQTEPLNTLFYENIAKNP